MLFTIIIFALVLSILVFAHELGHFLTARRLGVRAEEFGFGFPPRIFGWQFKKKFSILGWELKKGRWHFIRGNRALTEAESQRGTVYSLNWIPIGGFVRIKGENGEGKNDHDSFAAKSIGKRALILSAGVIMNIVLAFVLFSACFMIGAPQATVGVGQIQIEEVIAKSPAEKVGLKPGDIIVSLDNQKFSEVTAVQNFISQKKDQPFNVEIKRGGEIFTTKIQAEVKDNSTLIGVGLGQIEIVRYPWYKAIWEGFKYTGQVLWLIIVAFFGLLKNLVTGVSVGEAVGGPVRIAQMTGDVARVGLVYLLNFTALLSLNLAVINFFPFPALDGGRILFLIIEKFKGRPVKRELETAFHNIGFVLLMMLIIWVTIKDVLRIFN